VADVTKQAAKTASALPPGSAMPLEARAAESENLTIGRSAFRFEDQACPIGLDHARRRLRERAETVKAVPKLRRR